MMYKELLLELVSSWTNEQLDAYIKEKENRVDEMKLVIRELRELRRRRNKKQPLDTGERSGA